MPTPSTAERPLPGTAVGPGPWSPRLPARLVGALAGAGLAGLSVLAVRWDHPAAVRHHGCCDRRRVGDQRPRGADRDGGLGRPGFEHLGLGRRVFATLLVVERPGGRDRSPGRDDHDGAAGTPHAVDPPGPAAPARPGPLRHPRGRRRSDHRRDPRVDPEQWQRREVGGDARVENLVWTPQGATLFASGEPGADGACRWDHQAVQVPSDLSEGRTWSSKVGCDSTISGRAVHLERVETAEVRQRARTHIDGVAVDTWVIDRRVVLTIDGKGISTVSDATSTELFAPDLGLPVFQMSRTQGASARRHGADRRGVRGAAPPPPAGGVGAAGSGAQPTRRPSSRRLRRQIRRSTGLAVHAPTRAAHPDREAQVLRPAEAGAAAPGLLQAEPARAGDQADVADAHGPARGPTR